MNRFKCKVCNTTHWGLGNPGQCNRCGSMDKLEVCPVSDAPSAMREQSDEHNERVIQEQVAKGQAQLEDYLKDRWF